MQRCNLNLHVFADDILIYGSCASGEESTLSSNISDCVLSIEEWLKSNQLLLNTDKTKVMWCATRQRLSHIHKVPIPIGRYTIKPSLAFRYLGVLIDETLSFSSHVSKIISSSFGTLRQIRSIRRSVSQKHAAFLVSSLVFPILDFCAAAFVGLTKEQLHRLQSVINASARVVGTLPRFAHVSDLIHQLNWPSANGRINQRLAILTYKCLHDIAPWYLCELLTRVSDLPNRSRLRSASTNNLVVPRFRLSSVTKKHFSSTAAHLWNALPSSYESLSLSAFNSACRDFFMHE